MQDFIINNKSHSCFQLTVNQMIDFITSFLTNISFLFGHLMLMEWGVGT